MALSAPTPDINYRQFAEVEASYGDTTATPAAGDAFLCRDRTLIFKRVLERLDRDQDADATTSVHTTQKGRESATWEVNAAITPSGVTGTPTAPDMGEFFRAHFGVQDVAAGHSTCTSGSTTTVVEGAAGATTALGAVAGDFIGVVTTAGVEYRQIVSIATDAFTVAPALTSAPANGSAITGTVTYRLSSAADLSMVLYSYLNGDNFREMLPGCAVSDMEVSIDLASGTPEAMVKFSGPGARIQTFSTTIPTPTTAGQPLVPLAVFAWFGATKQCPTSLTLTSNNGQELRNNEGCTMYPSGIKRTGNGGKYLVNLDIEMLLTGSAIEGYFDNADALTAYDVTVQINNEVGKSFGFRLPKFVPDAEPGSVEGEVSMKLAGRCYGNGTANTELACFFG
jgi:hypothetical protein